MSAWTTEELTRIGEAGEMDIATRRADGTLRKPRRAIILRRPAYRDPSAAGGEAR